MGEDLAARASKGDGVANTSDRPWPKSRPMLTWSTIPSAPPAGRPTSSVRANPLSVDSQMFLFHRTEDLEAEEIVDSSLVDTLEMEDAGLADTASTAEDHRCIQLEDSDE